ncbi:hypothetical protein GCM10009118_31490 [Wandonia haliotis]|uniref:Cytochrome P450 n=1 Tax=Wandonia haliotis TaxID=574963 RepID=A0ABP3Y5D7_9FLAO
MRLVVINQGVNIFFSLGVVKMLILKMKISNPFDRELVEYNEHAIWFLPGINPQL